MDAFSFEKVNRKKLIRFSESSIDLRMWSSE